MDMNQESLNMALEYLDKIGTKIGMTADTIWPWLVRQQYVYIGISFFILAAACFLVPVALYLSKKYHPWNDKLYGTEDADFIRVFRCGIIVMAAIAAVVGIFAAVINTPRIFNPEFYALKSLLDLIK